MAYIMTEYIGLNGQKVAAIQETVSGRFYQLQGLALADGNVLGGEDLGSGYGLYVINVAKQEVTGVFAEGDDLTDGLPVYLGAYACTSLVNGTPLTDQKMRALRVTADGRLLTLPYHNPEDGVTGTASNTNGNSTEVVAAQATGIRTYLTWVHLVNTHASTGCYVEMKDGSTVKDTIYVGASSSKEVPYPTPLAGSVATAWNFDPSAAVTTIICTVGGYKSKV